MKLNKFVSDYLNFSRKERIGILILLFVLIFIFFLPSIKRLLKAGNPSIKDSSWITAMKNLEDNNRKEPDLSTEPQLEQTADRVDKVSDRTNAPPAILFYFDPNTLPETGWLKLGIPEKTIRTIQHYRDKGGEFRKAGDLRKVYGLAQIDYERLAPYIKIENSNKYVTKEKWPIEKRKDHKEISSFAIQPFDINSADTTAFISLPGIGNKLAARIVKFRDKLGGFYSVDQLQEIYGLADSVFRKIKPYLKLTSGSLKKINLNTATKDELKNHPYIKWTIANALIEYRNQHGPFTSLEEIKKILILPADLYEKLINYLAL